MHASGKADVLADAKSNQKDQCAQYYPEEKTDRNKYHDGKGLLKI